VFARVRQRVVAVSAVRGCFDPGGGGQNISICQSDVVTFPPARSQPPFFCTRVMVLAVYTARSFYHLLFSLLRSASTHSNIENLSFAIFCYCCEKGCPRCSPHDDYYVDNTRGIIVLTTGVEERRHDRSVYRHSSHLKRYSVI